MPAKSDLEREISEPKIMRKSKRAKARPIIGENADMDAIYALLQVKGENSEPKIMHKSKRAYEQKARFIKSENAGEKVTKRLQEQISTSAATRQAEIDPSKVVDRCVPFRTSTISLILSHDDWEKIRNINSQLRGTTKQDSRDASERYEEAFEAYRANQYSKVITLFDVDKDYDYHPNWINLLGIVFDNTEYEYFDEELAHKLFLTAAHYEFPAAAYNLAVRWEEGYYSEIDPEKALSWYLKACDLGHGCSVGSASDLLIRKALVQGEDIGEIEQKIQIMHKKALAERWPQAMLSEGASKARKLDDPDTSFEGLSILHELAYGEFCGPPKATSAIIMALRRFLGVGLTRNFDEALSYIECIPQQERQADVRYGIANIASKIKFIIEEEIFRFQDDRVGMRVNDSSKLPPDYEEAFESMDLYFQRWEGKDVVPRVMTASPALSNVLWAAVQLAEKERWGAHSFLYDLWTKTQHRLLDITLDTIFSATQDSGPRYNLTSEDGCPIIGTYEKAGKNKTPSAGITNFQGVTITKQGDICINATYTSAPAFITQDDIKVAMVFAFYYPDGPIYPTLSLEPYEPKTPEKLRYTIEKKVFMPSWIGHTDIGKTQYWTDYWLGSIAGHPDVLVQKAKGIVSDEKMKSIVSLMRDFAMAGGRDDGLWHRVMLSPTDFQYDFRRNAEGSYVFTVKNIDVMIDGADCMTEEDGSENRVKNLNDDRFKTGRVANLITSRYKALSELFPEYERYRQLCSLVLTFGKLREMGFSPKREVKAEIVSTFNYYNSKPKLTPAQLLVS